MLSAKSLITSSSYTLQSNRDFPIETWLSEVDTWSSLVIFHRTFSITSNLITDAVESVYRPHDQQKLSNFVVYSEELFEIAGDAERWVLIPTFFLACFNNSVTSTFFIVLSFFAMSSTLYFNAVLFDNAVTRLSAIWRPMVGKRMLMTSIWEPAPSNVMVQCSSCQLFLDPSWSLWA